MKRTRNPWTYLTLLLLCLPCTMQAQVKPADPFTPTPVNTSYLHNITEKLQKAHETSLKNLPKENYTDFRDAYNSRWGYIKARFDEKEVYTAKDAQQYLDSLTRMIVRANPILKGNDINCYFSRSEVPNASYIGEGIILFNMGLFSRLDNESQLAFVLCHELSHYYLHHSDKAIEAYISTMRSRNLQKELSKIKKESYNKKEHAESLAKGIKFDSRRHSRGHEAEADSLGLVLMHNAGFDPKACITALAMLDTIDADTMHMAQDIRNMFTNKDFTIEDRWVTPDRQLVVDRLMTRQDSIMADSLKTHPDCKERIAQLTPVVAAFTHDSAYRSVSPAQFDQYRKRFRYETIDYAYTSDNYTAALYQAMAQLGRTPEDPYLVTAVGKIFNEFYHQQKMHTLGKKIQLPSPYQNDSYNLLLQFVQHLYLEDYARLNLAYLTARNVKNYAPFVTELERAKSYVQY